jgi:hypothetical protein
VTLTANGGGQELPAELAQRIAQQADLHFAKRAAATISSLDAARGANAPAATSTREPAPVPRSNSGAYGWFAAAACLVLAVFGWMRAPAPVEMPPIAVMPPAITRPVEPPPAPRARTPAEERLALLANAGSVKVTLSATKDPAAKGVTGDAVWDPVTQKGFLHFVGLASNDTGVSQYQIWIFDAGRDKRYPIDGGVFDVPADADEVVIPINANLNVSKVAAFAVTVEKPGGVVVSARQHVVVLGAAG